MKKTYSTTNSMITGMSDDDFYGREEALGVDLDACRRAAVREVRCGLDLIVHGRQTKGALQIRRAVYRLAVTIGNQSVAESYLADVSFLAIGNVVSEKDLSDRAELDRGAAREHAHPGLLASLKQIESDLRSV